ncbi:DUF1194 domain-containing protein [Alteromonas sp. KUL106]|uniref:DUF1194 domain-containing protein n=1 Tax=Alteromonas sp. KUL106 TaxID=2480799 RepID=UPI0012E46B06|nr:DUF1194 domain-containing protein [Alteromonas sp. KUL106]GFD66745.1 hypothetical protein KUL106_00080 [Alteromonas sp. KUL106]
MTSIISKAFATLAIAVSLIAPTQAALIDIELSLVIDVSGSVDTTEYNLQMDGYANAFRNSSVISNIENSTHGIAVNAIFFASNFYTTSLDAFSVLKSEADALAFANLLSNFVRPGSGGTSIYRGVNRAVDLLLNNGLDATKGTIIDVSGDGLSSASLDQAARDNAVNNGMTINGIAIGGTNIANYFSNNVIGGNGAFLIEASDFNAFQTGIIEKLRTETQTVPEPPSFVFMLITSISLYLRRRISSKV